MTWDILGGWYRLLVDKTLMAKFAQTTSLYKPLIH